MGITSRRFGVRVVYILAAASLALAALAGGSVGASAAVDPSLTNPKHFFRGLNSPPDPNALTNDLIYHGGNVGTEDPIGVETTPSVYLIWWGAAWATGFTTPDFDGTLHSSSEIQRYTAQFFANVGGSAWGGVQTQYCKNVPAGTTSCKGFAGAQYVQNPAGQLKGVWTDSTNPVPPAIYTLGLAENLADDPIAAEAVRAAHHFGWHRQANYIIFTPDMTVATGQPVYCGYHTQTTSIDDLGNRDRLQYAFIPFLNHDWGPGLGRTSCGMHYVNQSTDAFGHGIWDAYSQVTGHEYGEAETDPDNFFSVQDGWNDDQTSENGDKCAWQPTNQNVPMGPYTFAVQAMWSNEAFDAGLNGCQVKRI